MPNTAYRIQIRKETEAELRNNFKQGTYVELEEIATILKFLYEFHYNKICAIIKGVNSKNAISFLLYQYEIVNNNSTQNDLPQNLILFKETILFLIDLIVENKQYEASNAIYFQETEFFSKIWIHAQNAFEYSDARNFAMKVGKEDTQLIIFPEGSPYFITQNPQSKDYDVLNEFDKVRKNNIELRNKYLNGNDLEREILAIVYDNEKIDFKKEFGISYIEFKQIVLTWVQNSKKVENPQNIPCLFDYHIASIAEGRNISNDKIEALFNGITSSWNIYKYKKREIWNYVQQERSRKRPLIKINYNGNDCRLFSPIMLEDRICGIGEDIVLSPHDRLPKEWDRGSIRQDLSRANNEIGKWFERLTVDLLKTVDIIGFKPGKKIRLSANETIQIDSKIGPPDFIGYSQKDKSLIIIECKLLDCVFESKGIQGELIKFLSGKKDYTQKLKEKINWIQKNHSSIKKAINFTCKISVPQECEDIYYCFVTYYPTTLRYFYSEIPSPTLVELVDLYLKGQKWPFEFGKIKVKK